MEEPRLKGSDIRRYRRTIGLNQADFARRLGVTQSALSRFEAGRIAISDEHLAQLRKGFPSPDVTPSFAEFSRHLEQESQPALTRSLGRHLLLTVWPWEEGFDLSKCPPADSAAGVVAIPFTEKATIAFRMARSGELWTKGDVIIFEECDIQELRKDDVCLVHQKAGRASTTTLVRAEIARTGTRLRGMLSRSQVIPDDAVLLLMRAVTRSVDLK